MFLSGSKKQIALLKQELETVSRRAEALEKEISSFRGILGSMIEGVIAMDKDTRVVSTNPAIEKIFNVSREGARGKLFLEVIPNNDILEIISSVLEKKEVISKELTLVWPLQRTFQINASPILGKDSVNGCLLVIHDISQIRRLERVRSDFVANVSHELKTPLTSILGFVETLLEGALEDKENSRQFLKIIAEHAKRLDNLTNDLLSLSFLESQQAQLKKEKLSLQELTDKVLSGFRSQLKKKQIEARNRLPSGFIVSADKNKIEQVLTNLIDNAIKFNKEKGWINIDLQDAYHGIKILVEDSGQGIPEKDIPRIFERFYRVDKARSRELGGTGLGLSIVKHVVELHGGSVSVESTEGLGSKFWFILPQ